MDTPKQKSSNLVTGIMIGIFVAMLILLAAIGYMIYNFTLTPRVTTEEPVLTRSFKFHNLTDDTVTVIYNFNKIVIPAGWKSIQVFKGNETFIFTDGYWGYQVYDDQVINVTMDGEDYTTKSGFGAVCLKYIAETRTSPDGCPLVSQEFTRSYGDFWLYYPKSNETDTIITPK